MNEPKTIDVPSDARQAVQVLDHSPTPMDLIQRAVQSNAQVETMEKLMGLQERYERNESRKAFDSAISKAKSEIPVIRKNNSVDFTSARGRTNYSYEDLATIAATIDPILSKYGLSYRFRTNSDSKSVTITCVLSHSAGHCEENSLYAPHDASGNKNAIQAVGSAVTYLQRYTLKAALGLAAAADDDARGANPDRAPAPQQQAPAARPAPATTAPAPARQSTPQPDGEQFFPVVQVLRVKEVHSKPESPKKWTAFFITFNDGFNDLEAATFDRKIADFANELANTGENASLTTKPGRKEGSKEIVSLTRAEQPPMGEAPSNYEPELPEVQP
jgi:hypothetical protein